MNKKELIAKLKKLGIAHDPEATNKELEALLPSEEDADEKDSAASEETAAAAEGLEVADDAEISVTGGGVKAGEAVDVVDEYGGYIRTYDPERHGKEYRHLADAFISKPNHVVRKYKLVAHDPHRANIV